MVRSTQVIPPFRALLSTSWDPAIRKALKARAKKVSGGWGGNAVDDDAFVIGTMVDEHAEAAADPALGSGEGGGDGGGDGGGGDGGGGDGGGGDGG
jgi:hypothetical protein